jgi:exonuclease SbcD
MRLIHTSDWHLGHTLRGEVARDYEHAGFLAWLVETCVRQVADVLLVTGDVFDSATPPASAERMWFELLAAVRRARPAIDIVAIAGNHDSPARLGAASSVLRELGVHIVGSLPRHRDGALDLDRILIPVAGGRGLIAAVPFLRPSDLVEPGDRAGAADLGSTDAADPAAAIYREVIAAARRQRRPDQALIATGHLYVAGADSQFLSERRVSIGGQESASLRMFPDDIDYVALGHIHRAQRVGRASIRYAGAPLPLSLDEADYKSQVVAVEFAGGRLHDLRSILVPRMIDIVRVPRRGAAPLAEVVAELARLPLLVPGDPARPYLEVVVALERPEPKLRAQVEAALEGKRPRLIRLGTETTGDGGALGDQVVRQRLAELDPRDVFVRLWNRDHAEPPSPTVLAGFDQLLAELRGDREDLAS